jgi:sec-independent protein translocase protein TatC
LDTTTKSSPRPFDEPIPLLTHLEELKKRLIYSLIAVAICSVAVYPAVDTVIRNLAKPVGKFVFTGPVEAFWTRIKLAFFMGLIASMPVVLFQLWSFIQRGLMPKEKHAAGLITAVSFVLFISGAAFCYFLILPVGVKFLLAYGSDVMIPMITISRYLTFAFALVFAFGIVFELPLAMAFLVKLGLLHTSTLIQQRRIAIVVIFIVAAALTPGPDIFSQVLMAVPMLVLYEIGIIVSRIIEKKKQ